MLFTERQVFQLRAHMYQARSLIGSDASGLSDPFARVVIGDQGLCTQVIDETLSPTWDEMLIFNEVIMYGVIAEVTANPPNIIIEVFDQDRVVSRSVCLCGNCRLCICSCLHQGPYACHQYIRFTSSVVNGRIKLAYRKTSDKR